MPGDYIEMRNGGYYVAGTRVSLESVVIAFQRGDSPERILDRYPLLGKPARVYGAIAFYLDHQDEVDAYVAAARREFEESVGPDLSESDPVLWQRMQRARTRQAFPSSSESPS